MKQTTNPVALARAAERAANRAFAAGNDSKAARLMAHAARLYDAAHMPQSAAMVRDAARACLAWAPRGGRS